jgi:uncharacterized protein
MNEFLEWKNRVKKAKVSKLVTLTIAPTFNCNFRCVYCIQEGKLLKKPAITKEKINKTFNFFDSVIKREKIKRANLILYGGEPITMFDSCLYIINKFKDVCKSNGVKIEEMQIVTNGSLLDKNKMNKLKEVGIHRAMITLDGLRETHNKRRVYPSNPDTFSKIFRNIIYFASKGVEITASSVIDTENIDEIIPLIKFFKKHVEDNKKIKKKIVFSFALLAETSCTRARSRKFLINKETEIRKKIVEACAFAKKNGFRVGLPHEVIFCEREDKYGFLIDPQGKIYKCFGVLGMPGFSIGNVNQNLDKIFNNAKKYTELKIIDDGCQKCCILPLCRGGCQHDALIRNGEYGVKKFCEKPSLMITYKEYLKKGLY